MAGTQRRERSSGRISKRGEMKWWDTKTEEKRWKVHKKRRENVVRTQKEERRGGGIQREERGAGGK
jgi:hypothetical protein